MAMPISNTHLRVPRGFGAILEGLTREILRDQPKDIPHYAAEYFDTLVKQREERGTDPSEWAAKLEDRYYNNHLFKTSDCTSRTVSNIDSQDFMAEEEPSPVITRAESAKGPLDTDTSTQADGLSNEINSSVASEQNNSESERNKTQLLASTGNIEISDDSDQQKTDLENEPGSVSAVDLEKETAASVIKEDASQKALFECSEVGQQSPVSQLEMTEQKEEITYNTASDALEESSKHESFVEISFDDVPENDQSENNELMIKEIMDKTEEILNEQEEILNEQEEILNEQEEILNQQEEQLEEERPDVEYEDDILIPDSRVEERVDSPETLPQFNIKTDDEEDEEINIPTEDEFPSLQDLTEETTTIVEERHDGETEDDHQKSEDDHQKSGDDHQKSEDDHQKSEDDHQKSEDDHQKSEDAGDVTQLDVKISEGQEFQEKGEDDLLEGNEEEQEEGSLEKYFTVSHEDQHSDEEDLVEGFTESEIREGHFSPELDHDDPELEQCADGEDNTLHQEKRDSPDREQQINEKQEECSRPQEEEDIMDIPLDDPEANRAAAKIQAGFRGHMTRKKMKPEDKTEGEERAEDRGQ